MYEREKRDAFLKKKGKYIYIHLYIINIYTPEYIYKLKNRYTSGGTGTTLTTLW